MSDDINFAYLKTLCLLAFRRAALELSITDGNPSEGPAIQIVVKGSTDFLVAKAIEGLTDEGLVSSFDTLKHYAKITAKGLTHSESDEFKKTVAQSNVLVVQEESHSGKIPGEYLIQVVPGFEPPYSSAHISNAEARNNLVPASDRYVSVRDNQEPFDQLEKSLDEIKDEFARDHNRGDYEVDSAETHLLNVDIVKAQIKRGWVSLDELRDQLRPSLQKLEADCKSLAIIGGTMLGAIAAALKAIQIILGS